jgi:hypothetical protein
VHGIRNLEHKVQLGIGRGQSDRLLAKALKADLSPTTGRGESALILRRTGIAALVISISLGMTSTVLFLAAFHFRFDRFFEPTLILGSGATSAELLRWAAVLDLFGYYLATPPGAQPRTAPTPPANA